MNKKKNYRNPNQRAEDYLQILLKGKIKSIHVTKRNNSQEEREQTIKIITNTLDIMGIGYRVQSTRKYNIQMIKDVAYGTTTGRLRP